MSHNPRWTWVIPAIALAFIALWFLMPQKPFLPLLLACGLLGSVVTAVHHAEIIALKLGEPFGPLILALSVTTIEVALVISIILQGGPEAMALPRDTLFAAVMIILNGIIGMSLLMGGRRNQQQKFHHEGTTDALCTLSLGMLVVSLIAVVLIAKGISPTAVPP